MKKRFCWIIGCAVGLHVLAVVPSASADRLAYVSNRVSDSVSVIDTATNNLVDTVSVGNEPRGVAVSPGQCIGLCHQLELLH